MKKLLYIAAVVILLVSNAVSYHIGKSKKPSNILEVKDTITWCNYYPASSLDAEINSTCDSLLLHHSPADTIYYNRLTDLICDKLYNNGEYWSSIPTDELLHNKKFVTVMDKGFDGLCGIDPIENPELGNAISYFYGAYNYSKKN